MNFTNRIKLIASICFFSFLGNISFSFLFSNEVTQNKDFDKQDIAEQEEQDELFSEVPENISLDGLCEDGRILEFLEFAFDNSPAEIAAILDEPEISEKIKQELIDTPEKVELYESLKQRCEEYQLLKGANVPNGIDIEAYGAVVQDSLYNIHYKSSNFSGVSFRWFALLFAYSLYSKIDAMYRFEEAPIKSLPNTLFKYGMSILFSGKFISDFAKGIFKVKDGFSQGEFISPSELHKVLDKGITDFKNTEASWESKHDELEDWFKAKKSDKRTEIKEKANTAKKIQRELRKKEKRDDCDAEPKKLIKKWFEDIISHDYWKKRFSSFQKNRAEIKEEITDFAKEEEKKLHNSQIPEASFSCFKTFDDPLRKYLERKLTISLAKQGWSPGSRNMAVKYAFRYPAHFVAFKAVPFSLYRGWRVKQKNETFFKKDFLFKGYDAEGKYNKGDALFQEMIKSWNTFFVSNLSLSLKSEIGYERMLEWKNKTFGLVNPSLINKVLNFGFAYGLAYGFDEYAKKRYSGRYEDHVNWVVDSKMDSMHLNKQYLNTIESLRNLDYYKKLPDVFAKRQVVSTMRQKFAESIRAKERIWNPSDFGCSDSAKKIFTKYAVQNVVSFSVMKMLSKTKGSSRVLGKCYDCIAKQYIKKGRLNLEQAQQLKMSLQEISLFLTNFIIVMFFDSQFDDIDLFELERFEERERITDLIVSKIVGVVAGEFVANRS